MYHKINLIVMKCKNVKFWHHSQNILGSTNAMIKVIMSKRKRKLSKLSWILNQWGSTVLIFTISLLGPQLHQSRATQHFQGSCWAFSATMVVSWVASTSGPLFDVTLWKEYDFYSESAPFSGGSFLSYTWCWKQIHFPKKLCTSCIHQTMSNKTFIWRINE